MNHLILNGFMGSGKTTVGRKAAERLSLPFVDLDVEIERRTGSKVSDIFRDRGESHFRTLESSTLRLVLAGSPKVIALGGGTLLDEESRLLVESRGMIVTLSASSRELEHRTRSGILRPLLKQGEETPQGRLETIERLLGERTGIYRTYPSVQTEGISIDVATDLVVRLFQDPVIGAGSGSTFEFSFPDGHQTAVIFARDGSGNGDPPYVSWVHEYSRSGSTSGVSLIVDSTVDRLYSEALLHAGVPAVAWTKVVLPPGEETKNLHTARDIYRRLQDAHVERSSTVLALGGGVICDIAGFVASTYLRGLALIAVPSTLLAQVDAAIGGKTGVDFNDVKNLVGTFYPARFVFVDPRFLHTLPDGRLGEGLAEMVKIAFVRDEGLLADLETLECSADVRNRVDLIRRSIRNKIEVVLGDPYEQTGERAMLNFGHTIGHGIEALTNYRLSHGECVSIGMVTELRIAAVVGAIVPSVLERLTDLLRRLQLPVDMPDVDLEELLAVMRQDKKRRGGSLRMTILREVGRAQLEDVREKDVVEVLAATRLREHGAPA